jgi:Helix-turn-helix
MSHNQGDAATTAREEENQQTQTPSDEPNTQGAQSATPEQQTGNAPTASPERQAELAQATGAQPSENPRDEEPRAQTGADNQLQAGPAREANWQAPASASSSTPAQTAASAIPQPTGDPDEGVASSANVDATAPVPQASREQFEPRPDVSDVSYQELVPKLLALFNNNREQLGRALGLHRSTVDRWLNGKSRPNTSTILRMRRLAQERNVE